MSTQKQILLQPHPSLLEHYKIQNFYHGMWGYFFPAIYMMNRISQSQPAHFYLHNNGDIMNKNLEDLLQLFEFSYEICDYEGKPKVDQTIILPPWDFFLAQYGGFTNAGVFGKLRTYYNHIMKKYPISSIFSFHTIGSKIKETRKLILSKIDKLETTAPIADHYLILERSPGVKLFFNDGSFELKDNGAPTRSLINIQDGIKYLENIGISAIPFQPGTKNLIEQIQHFRRASGVIGVFGAEFSNLIWMKEKSKVFMVGNKNSLPHSTGQAELFQLDLHVLYPIFMVPMNDRLMEQIKEKL